MPSGKLPELLAPAGSPDALRAAVDAGADAVYLGGAGFNARAYAANFAGDAMAEAVSYCHAYGVRVHVTLNTLLFDRELPDFLRYAEELYRTGIDAAIVADIGAITLLHRYLPDLPIHASTQASVHSAAGAAELVARGASRVVLARELSLADIRAVTTHAPGETEVFLHGALCVSHSGQCLFSSLVGGRSGNRGRCAQPCRLPYNGGKYPLSLRDLSLADHIPELIDAGVASLKIEGRMKSAAYVHGVVSVYRRLLDERRPATAEENRRLKELFSRSGFTDAYFRGISLAGMTGVRSEDDKQDTRSLAPLVLNGRRVPLSAACEIRAGEPARLTLTLPDGRAATVTGDVPQPAQNAPLTTHGVAERLAKLGGTPYVLAEKDLSLSLGDGLNLSPGALNSLRRAAVEALSAPDPARADFALDPGAIPALGRRLSSVAPAKPQTVRRTALCFSPGQADALRAAGEPYDVIFLPLFAWKEAKHRPDGVYLPPVVEDHERGEVLAAMRDARDAGIVHALVGNAGLLGAAKDLGFTVTGDYRLNVTNRESAAEWFASGVDRLILSPELLLPQVRDIGAGAVIVCGRVPLMLLERCFVKENFGCAACGKAVFTDRRGARFPLLREYQHRNILFNCVPTYMGDRAADLRAAGVTEEHFLFTTETPEEAVRLSRAYRAGTPLDTPCRRVGSKV